jgi:hypothetical protein
VLSPGAATSATTSGGGTAVLNLDGNTVARVIVPNLPGVITEYGLN